jgi:hypothetical protein
MVLFFKFAAGEFLDEEMFYIAARLAKAENRTIADVEAELASKMTYPKGESANHPFEAWGPQELADRINATKDIEVDP